MATIDVTGLPEDKVKYLEQLVEGWLQNIENSNLEELKNEEADLDQAWEEFFRIGDAIAEQDNPGQDTLTESVLSMRR